MTFNLKNSIKNIQNRIVASSIKQTSNIELLRSEEAIRDLINSYTERFKSAEGMLTDITKYVVKSKEVIDVKDFNDLFESLYIDLSALYNELDTVENVLNLNLSRNKNYFQFIKKRVRELWQRLRLTRLNVYDLNPADESFFESFYSNINIATSSNIEIDKKLGFAYIQPQYFRTHNQSFEVKKISTYVYPVENEEAGVVIVTSPLNSLSGNYSNSGTRDMLQNGLWKEEVICSEIPDMIFGSGILASGVAAATEYRGVVAVVEIEYAYAVNINRLDLDVYGEKGLDIVGVLYKTADNGSWQYAQKEVDDYQLTETDQIQYNTIKGIGFDVISFINIHPITVKVLRLIFNQKNFSFINTVDTVGVSLDEQINKDLSERRYDLLKFNASLEEELTAPVNEENKSIYSKLVSAIESTRNIEDILIKINDILVPELKVSTVDFGKTAKFELGTWSIEPKEEEYVSQNGIFETKPFSILDRHLIGATLTTKQSTPGPCTVNWYLSADSKNIPILESEKTIRKEPFNQLNMSEYTSFKDWPGVFCLLDFPISPYDTYKLALYQDSSLLENIESRVSFINSRLLYFHDITRIGSSRYVVKYPVAVYDCCNMYVLQPNTNLNNNITLGIGCTRREILELFINKATYMVGGKAEKLSKNYTISNALCTIEEAEYWFTAQFSSCLFIESAILSLLDGYQGSIFDSLISSASTKYATTIDDVNNYLNGIIYGASDLSIIGSVANMLPLSIQRSI